MEWSALGNGNGTEREEESNKKRSEYQIDGLDGNMFHQLGGRWRKGRNIPRGEKGKGLSLAYYSYGTIRSRYTYI